MRSLIPRLTLSLAALVFVAAAGASARADIVYIPTEAAPKGGVGHRPESILSIQSPRNSSSAAGGVEWNGSKDVRTGDAKNGEHTKTLTFAEAGISDAGALRIYMDTEDPDNDLLLNDLILTAYSSNGTVLFQGSLVAPVRFNDELNGQGKGDRVFGLTPDQAAQLQAAFARDPNLRLGLFASTSDDTGSFTNFKLGEGPAAPVPEPATLLLLGTGVAGVAAKVRRRRKQAKE